jgi:hypothetical protein
MSSDNLSVKRLSEGSESMILSIGRGYNGEGSKLYNSYVFMYCITMKKVIGQIISYQHEQFRLDSIKKCEEEISNEKEREQMIKYFKDYRFSVPKLDYLDFDNSECSIVQKMNEWCEEFVLDNNNIIWKDFKMNVDRTKPNKLVIIANVKKIKEFCLLYIEGEKDKYKPMTTYIDDFIHKHESMCLEKLCECHKSLVDVVKMNNVDIVEEKVVPKSKSQLKKEKTREANKRRDQEKIEKQKRQEKEAKHLEQKRKEAERKRIAVCRAKRK